MSTRISLDDFEKIYNQSYKNTFKYILQKSPNIEDINDLVQETYLSLYEYLQKKKIIELENYQAYLMTIAKKQLSKHYGLIYKIKQNFVIDTVDEPDCEVVEEIDSKINIEKEIIMRLDAEKVWEYIKKKNVKVAKIFYLYFHEDYKIKEIAVFLEINESNVKNILYRNLKEVRNLFVKEGEFYE